MTVIDSFNHRKTDTLKKADVVIMLGSGDISRMEKSVQLYHKDYVDFVMIIPERNSVQCQSTKFALELGIPKKQ